MMTKLLSNREKLITKISDFITRESIVNILLGVLKVFSIVFIFFLFLILIESVYYFSSFVRTLFIAFTIILFLVLTILFTVKFWSRLLKSKAKIEISRGAKKIGGKFPDVKDNLLNSIQLIENNNGNVSKELTEAAFENVFNKVAHLNFFKIIDYSVLKRNSKLFLTSLIVLFSTIFFISELKDASNRLINFNKDFVKPMEFSLEVISGNKKIKKGENISLVLKANGNIPKDIILATKHSNEAEYTEHLIKPDSNNLFKLGLRNVNNSLVYFGKKNEVTTETYIIEVTSPPIINNIDFEIIPPKYSKLPISIQNNNGNIISLKGTKVNYNLTSTKQLISAIRIFDKTKTDTLLVAEKKVNGSFIVRKDGDYYFKLLDKDKINNENPIQYSIKVVKDEYPEIEIQRPEQLSLLPANDIVSINYTIKDDFGFTRSRLKFNKSRDSQFESENLQSINLEIEKNNVEQTSYYNWDISRMGFKEGDIITYYIEVFDNDVISGPKSTRSEIHKLRVPTLDELFAQANNTQESASKDLKETMQEADDLHKEIKQIRDELKKNEKNIDWNEKERIQESVKKFEEITKKIENVQKNLEKMRQEMAENNLISEETMKKYNELQDLMDELSSEELKKAMRDMQNSLEQLLRDNVQKSLDNLAINEEMFQKSIERTMNLLKKIQIEQKMDEVIKRTEKMVEDLNKLSEETKNNLDKQNDSDNKKLANEQNKINDNLDSLEKELKKLHDRMNETNNMPIQKMDELNQKFEEQKNQELSKDAEEQLQKQNPFDALKKQNQISQNMKSMNNELKQMQKDMQQQSQQMVMQNMLQAIENLIGLSKEQEALRNETKKLGTQPEMLQKMAQPQMDIRNNLDNILKQLSDLSQKTFAITPEMGEALGNAKRNIDKSIAGMQNRNGNQSSSSQGESMKNLNIAASLLQNSLANMMQGGGQSGGGMMSMMQQLQQMAQQQMGLNKMTRMMQQGQLSMQQQAQLQRLAQEQSTIQKSLAELNKEAREAGESKKLASNLEKVLDDMKEVISGLNTKQLDDNLIKTQEKILSKLLDAQRSINERDFEKNRESFTGKEFNLQSPEDLILSKEQAKDVLREELMKSIKEGYSKDYQDLIRRYFESLNGN